MATTGSSCVQTEPWIRLWVFLHGHLLRGHPSTWPALLHLGHLGAMFAGCDWAGVRVWPQTSRLLMAPCSPQTQEGAQPALPSIPTQVSTESQSEETWQCWKVVTYCRYDCNTPAIVRQDIPPAMCSKQCPPPPAFFLYNQKIPVNP